MIALEVYVTARENAVINISNTSGGFNEEVNVPANSSELITVPIGFLPQSEGKFDYGFHLTSDVDVSVYTLNKRQFSADAAVILPTNVLGKEYWVMAHREPEGDGQNGHLESQMLIVATEDNTMVEIVPSVATFGGWEANNVQTISLNAGETYQVKSEDDLTGTYVKVISDGASCSPIAVFGGNKFTNVGGCGGNRDHLVEQMFPTSTWGKDFLYVPYQTRIGGDYVKILATEDATTINISDMSAIQLNSGEWITFKALPGTREIKADKPIQVGQFSRSTACDNVPSDPFMIMLSPLQQRVKQITFEAFTVDQIDQFYLTLVTRKEGFSDITLDGVDISSQFGLKGNAAFALLNISRGTHTLLAPDGVIAYIYGYGQSESFGYSAGVQLENLSLTIEGNDTDIDLVNLETCPDNPIIFEVLPADPDNSDNFSKYEWNMGDGTVIEGQQIEHVYTEPGDYIISLNAEGGTDVCGESSTITITRELTVLELEVPDIVGAASVCPDVTGVEYSVAGLADNTNEWTVVGGTILGSPTGSSIVVDWGPTRNDASVSVQTRNSNGCNAIKELQVMISKRLEPALPVGPNGLCHNDFSAVTYSTAANPGSEYDWFVEGGSFIGSNTGNEVRIDWDGPGIPGRIWYREFNPLIADCEGLSEVYEVTIYADMEVVISTSSVLCFGENSGASSFDVSGGKPGNYRLRFQGNEIIGTELTNLAVGNYTVTVIDALECTKEVNFTIEEPSLLRLEFESVDVACSGEANGEIKGIANGGTPPYMYSIDDTNFQNSQEFTGLQPGDYTITVIDTNGCISLANVSIAEPTELSLAINLAGGNTITAAATGGTAPYQYSIDGTTFQESATFNVSSSGEFTVTVRDANDCTVSVSESFIVTSFDLPGQLPAVRTYPNPIEDVLIISQVDAGDAIMLVNLKGEVINQVAVKVSEKDFAVPITNIREGIFLLRIKDHKGRLKLIQKVIRKD